MSCIKVLNKIYVVLLILCNRNNYTLYVSCWGRQSGIEFKMTRQLWQRRAFILDYPFFFQIACHRTH